MLPTDSNTSQDNDIQKDNVPLNESSIIEPNVVETSNVETKSFATETKKISQITQLYLPQIPKIMILKWTFN